MKRIFTNTFKTANVNWSNWKKKIDERRAELEKQEHAASNMLPSKNTEPETVIMEISMVSVLKASLVVVGVILLSKIALELVDIFTTFLIALFLSAVFNPGVNKLEKWGIPRSIGIISLLALVFGVFFFVLAKIIPVVADQLTEIAWRTKDWAEGFLSGASESDSYIQQKFHALLGNTLEEVNSEKILSTISANIEGIATNLTDFAGKGVQLVSGTIEVIFTFVLILLLTFFLVVDQRNMKGFFQSLFAIRHQGYLVKKMELVQDKIGEWVHGQILLFFIVGTMAFLFFFIMDIPYALTLGMVFGIAEFVPYLGPAFSFLISAPVAFSDSLTSGIALIIFYAILQFIEGNFLIPLIMKKTVGLPPIATLLALIVGASFPNIINPIMGMILAVPVATILAIFIRDFTDRNTDEVEKKEEEKPSAPA